MSASDFIVTFGIPLAYIALGIAAVAAVVFPFIQMFQDPKKAKSALLGVGALVLVFVLCYLLADKEPYTIGDIHVAAGQMKLIEAGLYAFYAVLAGSVIAILYSSVARYFK